MLTGEIRNQVDQIWNAFWSGGVLCANFTEKKFKDHQHFLFETE